MSDTYMKSSKPNPVCQQQPLVQLLRDELDEKGMERATSHLDQCEACQRRLTSLAAGRSWWVDASRWLETCSEDLDPCDDDSIPFEFGEGSAPSNAKYLLESGLLKPSQQEGMIGSLGRYQVRRIIGAGGTGIVLQGNDEELNRVVAIKVLSPWLAAHGPARRRFAREGQAVAAVVHENVVAIHHVEANGPVPFLVMQYIDGDSLQDYVIRNGPLDVPTALRITAQVSAALSAAHEQGLVHRDVKPANILVAAAGQRVWITDFGLARAVDDASLTRTGFIAGTPHYMSPEQARGETVQTGSDLFGLGSVLYFMLTGRPPFRAERTLAILHRICNEPHRPVREVNPDVPQEVANLLDRLLEKDVAKRFLKGEDIRTECLRLLLIRETAFDTFSTPNKSPRFWNRMKYLVVLPLLLAACLLGSLAVWKNALGDSTLSSRSTAESPVLQMTRQKSGTQSGPMVAPGPRQSNSIASTSPVRNLSTSDNPLPLNPVPQPSVFIEQSEANRWLTEFTQLEHEIDQTMQSTKGSDGFADPIVAGSRDRFLEVISEFDRLLRTLSTSNLQQHGDKR